MKKTWLVLISLLLLDLSLPASAAINAWLDQNQVGPGESVQLTLQHDGRTDSQPDLSPLNQDFDVLGRSTSSSIQIVNGKMSATSQLTLTLAPKHGGKLLIPALQWDGQYTPALALTVSGSGSGAATPSASAPAGKAAHIFITTTLDQKQPYVQAAVTLTVRLYVDEPLYQASLDLQPSNDVLIQQLGQDNQSSVTRDDRSYQLVERKYLLFPQRSGEIRLAGPVLDAQVPAASNVNPFASDPFFGNVFGRNPFAGMLNSTQPVRIRGNPIVLNVRARPAGWTGHDWLPAQKVTLEETWQPERGAIHAGDPITRNLRLSAVGLTAPQLPDLSALMALPQGLRAYPDQPKLNTGTQGDGVVGTRTQDIALIASQAGRYVIPALHLSWWDTANNTQKEIDLPAHTLDVLPGSVAGATEMTPPGPTAATSTQPPSGQLPGSTPNPINAETQDHWLWFSVALALLWLGTVLAWWFTSRANSHRQTSGGGQPMAAPVAIAREAEARAAFRQACRENNPQVARRHLLDWARAVWPSDPPIGLKALAQRLDDTGLKRSLSQLDRACYAGGEWQGEPLLKGLKTLSNRQRSGAKSAPGLAGLYQ